MSLILSISASAAPVNNCPIVKIEAERLPDMTAHPEIVSRFSRIGLKEFASSVTEAESKQLVAAIEVGTI